MTVKVSLSTVDSILLDIITDEKTLLKIVEVFGMMNRRTCTLIISNDINGEKVE